MRTKQAVKLSGKLYGKLNIVFIALVALCIFLFRIAITQNTELNAEKGLPNEAYGTAQEITQEHVNAIKEIDGVVDASPIYTVNTAINFFENSYGITLYGIEDSYIQNIYKVINGAVFPQNSTMPYIVINQAAYDSIKKAFESTQESINASITMEDGLAAQICCVVEDGREEPLGFISIKSAKDIQYQISQQVKADGVLIMCGNIGQEEAINKELMKMNYSLMSDNTKLYDKWNTTETFISMAFTLAIAFLVCAICIQLYSYRAQYFKIQKQLTTLYYLGMRKRDNIKLLTIDLLRAIFISVVLAIVLNVFFLQKFLEFFIMGSI